MATMIAFNTRPYVRSHMREPRGTGSWAFELAERRGDVVWAPSSLTLAKAKAWMREHVKALQASGSIPATVRYVEINVLP